MPTFGTSKMPAPTDPHEFELIVRDALAIRWKTSSLQLNGRSGQAQAGVDISGKDDLGRFVGIQCKLSASIELKTVRAEASSAEAFKPPLQAFYMAVGGPLDARLQESVRLFSAEQLQRGSFPVGVVFWPEIISDLANDTGVFAKHYQAFLGLAGNKPQGSQLLAALDLGYLGRHVTDYINLLFNGFGRMAQEDPNQVAGLAADIKIAALAVLPEPTREDVSILCARLFPEVLTALQNGSWTEVDRVAAELDGAIIAAEKLLSGRTLAAYICGAALGKWAFLAIGNLDFNQPLERELQAAMTAVGVSRSVADSIAGLIAEFRQSRSISTSKIPHRVFNLIKAELRGMAYACD